MVNTVTRRTKPNRLLIGAHTSIAGGLQNALYEGASIGCTCVQLFTHSNRQWGMPPLPEKDVKEFDEARTQTGIIDIMVHASYLINIASSNDLIRKRSITGLHDELVRCETLKIPLLVVHPGSAVDQTIEEGLNNVIDATNKILEAVPHHHTLLLFENMAGQGSSVGSTFEQLAYIYNHIKYRSRVGFCIDVCHAFCAGYDINTEKGYKKFWRSFEETIGLKKLKAIHMNDSQREKGSHVDRHAHIGKGKIGLDTFRWLMNDKHLVQIPKILETPRNSLEDHARNLELLRSLVEE